VAAAVLTVPGVIGLHGGMFGETATYLPGRRVPGVRLTEDVTDIHLSVVYPVFATAQQVRTAVAALVTGPVNITVEDVTPATDAATTTRG